MKNKLQKFKFNINKDDYEEIQDFYDKNSVKCLICNGPIFYYNSVFTVRKFGYKGKSYKTFKSVNGKIYNLSVCEDCLIEKYPEYKNKNRARIFNMVNKITTYAFNIPEKESEIWKNLNYVRTKENYILKYGVNEGVERWEIYCDKQRKSNLFEYKKEKHGWNKDDFDNYNKSRSVTLENLIKKHGKKFGKIKYENYVKKQIETKSKEYYVLKHGKLKWDELCKQKAHNLSNYIRIYGKNDALIKLQQFYSKIRNYPASKSSQDYLWKLDKEISKDFKTYFYEKCNNKEYGKMLSTGRYVFIDYYIKELNLGIEYNGDVFHANPKKFKHDDKPNPFSNELSSDIWKKDEEKLSLLKKDHDIDIIVIWESDLPSIKKLIKEIYGKYML